MDINSVISQINLNTVWPIVILYVGPETFLPLISALAAISGALLMFWHKIVAIARKLWRFFANK